jgi:uncharacterized protein YndB with AHSA1/START domain
MSDPTTFVYVTHIRTTPEKLWQALTAREFLRQYWIAGPGESDWRKGSALTWEVSPGEEFRDLGQVVLESEPYRRLSYTWHTYQREWGDWTDEEFAELVREKRSKVTFDIEQDGASVKLTVTHDGFVPGSQMLAGITAGWPKIVSGLKTLLETGESLALA